VLFQRLGEKIRVTQPQTTQVGGHGRAKELKVDPDETGRAVWVDTRKSTLLFSFNTNEVQNKSKSNNNQNINKTSSIKKFNKLAIHNNLSSSFADNNIASVAKDNEYVKRRAISAKDLAPNIPGKIIIEAMEAAAKSESTDAKTFNWPIVKVTENLIHFNSTKKVKFLSDLSP